MSRVPFGAIFHLAKKAEQAITWSVSLQIIRDLSISINLIN